jgi:hypothetical protein
MKEVVILLAFVLSAAFISASCSGEQVDINSASLEELDKIVHVGHATAQRIINLRPFESLEELDKVPYISIGYIEEIKTQGLACIGDEKSKDEDEEETSGESESLIEQQAIKGDSGGEEEKDAREKPELEPIKLTAKSIKSEGNKENLKGSLALSGIIAFCIIFGAFFLFRQRRYKNEFK